MSKYCQCRAARANPCAVVHVLRTYAEVQHPLCALVILNARADTVRHLSSARGTVYNC